MFQYLTVVALFGFLIGASGFPNGAPECSCKYLDPKDGHGESTAKGDPHYNIVFSAASYRPNEKVLVTLMAMEDNYFKGFLIQGRSADVNNGSDPVGFFTKSSSAHIRCTLTNTGNAITHDTSSVKQVETFEWTAPAHNVGDIVFHYTVVRGGAPSTSMDPSDYYTDLHSSPLPPDSSATFLERIVSSLKNW